MRNVFIAFASLLILNSCQFFGGHVVNGNGIKSVQQRNITEFKGVSVVGDLDVILIPGAAYGVRVEADENLMEHIETEKDGDVLVVAPEKGYNLRPDVDIKVYITAPVINDIEVTGSGAVTSQGKITAGNRLKAEVTGSGNLKIDVDAPEVNLEIAGSGNVILGGTTRKFTSEIAGSGELNAYNLLSETTEVEISGSGNAQVFASKQLGVEINGSGSVDYKGNPTVNQEVNGSGSVKKVQ